MYYNQFTSRRFWFLRVNEQDSSSGVEVSRIPCAGDMDDLCYDAKRKRLYVISGHGTVTAIDLSGGREQLRAIGTVETAIGARTACWDPTRDSLYVACPATATLPARLLVYHAP